ncbi:ankyrin repeat domain-containing protein [Aspergillus mulundensis]|uniref:Uncharacterized protein n=1 Tax=Aspergillus mulundensis TaxID=1810919 RepID=A0A3D8RX67_9EURO|nr:Uncharacterized protein DSM5745_05509 [Aspergillus mulundensis]RDW78657.1 Uncharacterized protein DSM5745_05509 [Aspergillus mulundensis]
MSNEPLPPPQSTAPGWTKVSSDGSSRWQAQDPVLRRAQISRLVDTLSDHEYSSSNLQTQGHRAINVQAFHALETISKSDPLAYQWLPIAHRRRQRQFEEILAERQERSDQEARARETGRLLPRDRQQMAVMGQGCRYEDIPLIESNDLTFITETPQFLGPRPAYYNDFETACRVGLAATVQATISTETCTSTPAFLHHGLCLAVKAGNVEVARYLLASGAPIVRKTPEHILSAPRDKQIPLFELFIECGWTPNTPGMYGAVLLPSVMTDHSLLKWFLAHGANPNLGQQQEHRFGHPVNNSCVALEKAAYRGDVEAVRILLDAGAVIQNGFPLHAAAGACSPDWDPRTGRFNPSKDFDRSMIPVLSLLVAHGADVNQYQGPQRGNQVPNYAIVEAVRAGAVERVRWLLENGADPALKGSWGSAAEYASRMGSDEMMSVLQPGVDARKT